MTHTNDGFQTGEINGLPNSDSANAVRHTFLKGLRHYWQIGICQPIIELRYFSYQRAFHPANSDQQTPTKKFRRNDTY